LKIVYRLSVEPAPPQGGEARIVIRLSDYVNEPEVQILNPNIDLPALPMVGSRRES
jgi:hypothetical protein